MRRRVLVVLLAVAVATTTGAAGGLPASAGVSPGPGAVVASVPGLAASGRRGAVDPLTVEAVFGRQDVLSAYYARQFVGWSATFAPTGTTATVEILAFRATDPAQAVTLLRRWTGTVRERGGAVATVQIGFGALAVADHALGGDGPAAGLGARRGDWAVIVVRRPPGTTRPARPDAELVAAASAELAHLGAGGTSLTPVEGTPGAHTAGWVLVALAGAGGVASVAAAGRRRARPAGERQ